MYFVLEINFLRKIIIRKNIVLGNANCVELRKVLLRLPGAKHSNEGEIFKLRKNLISLLYQQGNSQVVFDIQNALKYWKE